eukprot:GGOE01014429.1.p1 GENE.GGOE01014429.1~~GGOE01014429.1.p1  ORF type:complete len:163 (+),score=69.58 GGOE01014429.1:58-546(+)
MSQSPSAKQREIKAHQLEKYLEEDLKAQLHRVLEQRDAVYQSIADYLKLQTTLQHLQSRAVQRQAEHGADAQTDLQVQVNLGNQFYMEACVPDTSHIFVNVGLGFHAELSLAEALEWLLKKEAALNADADRLTARATQLRFQLRLGYELLGSLLGYQPQRAE